MKYREVVTIPSQCATCPWLDALASRHDMAEEVKDELSVAIMNGEVNQGLFGLLLEEGFSIEEAEKHMADQAEQIHALNIEALEDLDDDQEVTISAGRKLLDSCGPEGAYVDADDSELVVCRSALAGIIGASIQE